MKSCNGIAMEIPVNFKLISRVGTAALVLSVCSLNAAADEVTERLFTLKVLPLLKDKCLGCHGGDQEDIKGDFSVLTREALLHGGESEEPAVVPGHPDEGTLVSAISWEDYEMPPKENDRLNEDQIAIFRRWIEQGAPWPDEAQQAKYRQEESMLETTEDGVIVTTSGGTSSEWTNRRYQPADLWAYAKVKPKSELLPGDVEVRDAIDFFVNRGLQDAGLTASDTASPRALIRRATFDLTGLPPTPEEIDAFEIAYQADAQQAWESLIDELLESPRYGEHWARHWFDVTRYADTGGMSNDYERSNMWRYRDYVIRAFNEDKPYDEFVIEQLAGDELVDRSVAARKGDDRKQIEQTQIEGDYTPEEAEWIVATGFLRMGPWDNAMIETEEARQIYLDDVLNITGQAFLSTTMRCCKCHDHKFDPIPTRDYYRMYSAFAGTHMAERKVPMLAEENQSGFAEGREHVKKMLDFAVAEKNRLVEKREAAARAWFDEHQLPYKDENARKDLPDEEKPPRAVGLDHVEQGQLKVREQDEWIWRRRLERYQPMAQSVFNADSATMAWNGARHLRITRKPKKQNELENFILIGGALTALGDKVLPGVMSAVAMPVSTAKDDPYLITNDIDGRRLELAQWIANPNNGLATRSIVNRIWQFHFGTGLAANSTNLGAKGAKPSYPELLDYLAGDFVEGGWTMKRMHRMIMLSDVYQRASSPVDRRVSEVDPDDRLLSHFPRRRLAAEEIRDGILASTGELVHCDGGLPVMPEINMEVALQPRMIQFSLAPACQPSPLPEQRNRRTVYAYHVRGQADPFTELFNQPNPNESCEVRESAAVTPQVFTLLNSDLIVDRSIALALRLEQDADTLPEQIDRAFRLVLGRHASKQESQWMSEYVNDMQAYHEGVTPERPEYPEQITRSLVEEFSGEPFEYTEILPGFANYQPDTKPSDVSPRQRAIADMCLLLLNSNEFMYID